MSATPEQGHGADICAPDAWPSPKRIALIVFAVVAAATALSHLAPAEHANSAVAALFLGASWWLVLRHDTATIRIYGLSLGGVTEPEPLSSDRLGRSVGRAVFWALLFAVLIFPVFAIAYRWWWQPAAGFVWRLPPEFINQFLSQLLVVALPEEAFFRGFLQSALDGHWATKKWKLWGAELGPGWLLSAAVFALGHWLTIPHPSRLAVFFPALLFGWLRARTGGIGAGLVFHALCNMCSLSLAHGYQLLP